MPRMAMLVKNRGGPGPRKDAGLSATVAALAGDPGRSVVCARCCFWSCRARGFQPLFQFTFTR